MIADILPEITLALTRMEKESQQRLIPTEDEFESKCTRLCFIFVLDVTNRITRKPHFYCNILVFEPVVCHLLAPFSTLLYNSLFFALLSGTVQDIVMCCTCVL